MKRSKKESEDERRRDEYRQFKKIRFNCLNDLAKRGSSETSLEEVMKGRKDDDLRQFCARAAWGLVFDRSVFFIMLKW